VRATASADELEHVVVTVVRLSRSADALCVSFEAFRPRVASRQAAAPQSHVWFRSAGIESAAHWTKYGPWWRRRHKAEDQPAVGAPTSETTYRVAREPLDSRCLFSRCQTSDAHGKPPMR
jgi:hypothetical protein